MTLWTDKTKLACALALTALPALPASAASAADLFISGGSTIVFQRFEGTSFAPSTISLKVTTNSGAARFRLDGLPTSVKADRTTGTATTTGVTIKLTVNQSLARTLGVLTSRLSLVNLDKPTAKPVTRFLELRTFASVSRGTAVFDSRCDNCHPATTNGAGPLLKGVYGRMAGSAVGYRYSPALDAYNKVWTYPLLLSWLTDPQKLVPGAFMFPTVTSSLTTQQRHDLIAYLASISKP